VGAMPDLPAGAGGVAALETAFRRLLDELLPILAGGLEAGLNVLIGEISNGSGRAFQRGTASHSGKPRC
jgi:hypothetical protein